MSHSSPLIETEVFFALNLFPVKSVPKVSWRTMPMGQMRWLIGCFKLFSILLSVAILTFWVEIVLLLIAIVCLVLSELLLSEGSELLLWHRWSSSKRTSSGSSPLGSASPL